MVKATVGGSRGRSLMTMFHLKVGRRSWKVVGVVTARGKVIDDHGVRRSQTSRAGGVSLHRVNSKSLTRIRVFWRLSLWFSNRREDVPPIELSHREFYRSF